MLLGTRSRYEVIIGILSNCCTAKLPSHMQREARLSGRQHRSIVASLVGKGMLETCKKKKKTHYITTVRGVAYVRRFSGMKRFNRIDPSDVPSIISLMNRRNVAVMSKREILEELGRLKEGDESV